MSDGVTRREVLALAGGAVMAAPAVVAGSRGAAPVVARPNGAPMVVAGSNGALAVVADLNGAPAVVVDANGAPAVLPAAHGGPLTTSTAAASANPQLEPLTSRTGVYTPARGAGLMQFGFDFPEPSVRVDTLLLGFRIQTFENVYALDADLTRVTRENGAVRVLCEGLLTCGGQVKAPGRLTAQIERTTGGGITWRVHAEAGSAIKSITSVVRGVPRGRLSVSCGEFFDPGDDERIFEYPQLFGGMSTPLAMLRAADGRLFELAARQDSVLPARFFFQPGPDGYRVELIHEHGGWSRSSSVETCWWRVGPVTSYTAAASAHFAHVERTYGVPRWRTRPDVPGWMRNIRLVVALHGAHWTGYIFNDYARMLEILRWVGEQIDPREVLVFLPAWDGRYYWNYPRYEPDPRMGGAEGFGRLVKTAQSLGFHLAPMFGANSANRLLPEFARFSDATTQHIDGDSFDLSWVDWDNDRRNEGWMPFMNLAVPSWREWLRERISAVIAQFAVDAYFLDIAGAWENNPRGDMYVGTRQLIADIRARHPGVPPIGEMLYDAQMACIPMSQVTRYALHPAGHDAYVRSFQHLSRPAPGRGSTGVHEAGFGRYEPQISPAQRAIPTLTVVDDTFSQNRAAMADYIARAKQWEPLGA
jgi:hypothetical protein